MNIFTGDGQPVTDNFPQPVSPFPATGSEFLYANPTALIHSSSEPPQKLRPIRSTAATERVLTCDGGLFQDKEGDVASSDWVAAGKFVPGCSDVGMNTQDWNFMGLHSKENEGYSSSSSDGGDLTVGVEERVNNRKRKRKSGRKYELLIERMVSKVMEKQEQMHKELLEMLEQRERERVLREEAWRKQEMERVKREEELRAQETRRSMAIISVIQNALGYEIECPRPLAQPSRDKDEYNGESQVRRFDPGNKRWPDAQVQALITLRAALEHKFRVTGSKGSIWEEISAGMQNMGYSRSAKKCKEKWENMNKYFKRSIESGKKRPDNGKTCQYFHELDVLYRSGLVNQEHCGLVNQGHSSSEKSNGNVMKLEE